MPIAAIPEYLGKDFSDASPALRFGLYLKLWRKDWSKETDTISALQEATGINRADRKLMDAFSKRQKSAFATLAEGMELQLVAKSIAPFTTGLGNEHPLENGFAFLNPYGLPYLPGSSVKGVVRRAAEELAGIAPGVTWEAESEDDAWTAQAINTLFGPTLSDTGSRRGALSFWDVMPEINGEKLAIEVMTPHYSHYYQQDSSKGEGSISPHDSGQPIPINFLTVPPGSNFTFHVVCDRKRLTADLVENDRWQALLQSAFEHAFTWCGFGAKTAVGYGAMKINQTAIDKLAEQKKQQRAEEQRQREREKVAEGLPPDAVEIVTFLYDFLIDDGQTTEQLLNFMEQFLDGKSELSEEAYDRLCNAMQKKWSGILENPDAVKGKKSKPKYKPRPRELARKLLAMKPS